MDELQERKANESDSESSSCNDDEGSSEKEETAEQKSRKCIEIRSSTQERLRSKRKQLPGTSANPDNLKIQKLTLKQPVSTNNSLTGHFRNCSEFVKELVKLNSSHTLHLNKCTIESLGDKIVPLTKKFKRIIFNNCNENVFKLFTNQNAIKGIEVYCDQFDGCSLKISKLVIDKINSDWFIGLKSARLKSLKDQNGSLKSLTIQQLPYDFDGGKVLKYIIEDMNLETFTYGNLCLIYNREKRQLIEFVASESQITSAVEMIRQFPSIRKFTLEILNSDISSENVESILKQDANLFNIIEEFVVIDRTKGTLGIFLDLFKSLIKLKKLVIWSNNRFINNIFKNLPVMKNLRELNLNTTAPPAQRYKSIKTFAPNLRILKVNSTWYTAANESFGNSNSKISIEKLDDENDPENSNVQRSSDNDGGESSRNERGAGNDDGDKKDDEKSDKSATPNTLQKYQRIVPKTLDFLFDSSFTDRNINDARKLYIHVCGHAKIILTDDNIEELEQLTQEEAFWEFVIAMFTEEGKIIIEFGSGADDSPHQFKAKMADLAYQLNEKIQLPLLPLLNNPQIIIKTTLINMTWDAFLTAVNRWNKNLSSQRWKEITNFSGNSLIFQADAESYYKIEGMGNKIYIGEKAFVEIAVDENERNVYEQDARAVSKYVVC